jgi:hypothetical protein
MGYVAITPRASSFMPNKGELLTIGRRPKYWESHLAPYKRLPLDGFHVHIKCLGWQREIQRLYVVNFLAFMLLCPRLYENKYHENICMI